MGRLVSRWMAVLCAVLAACALASPALAKPRDVEIEISNGRLVGFTDAGVVRFLGIPYAAPALGDQRFRAPAPAAAWRGARDARAFGPECPQREVNVHVSGIKGNEDCLHLNVYAPVGDHRNLPVMVVFHGGGGRMGNGRRDVTAFVREAQAIVATFQHRLDHLAFLRHPALSAADPSRSSGNYAFLDSLAALQWVQTEIGRFGGDPGNVTISGASGGGTMVCGMMVMPRAAGLFHRAMIHGGGGCWFPTETAQIADARGVEKAKAVGCDGTADVPACLRRAPTDAFFRTGQSVYNPFPPGSPEFYGAQPILGGSQGQYLDGDLFTRSWPDAFYDGKFRKVPTMVLFAENEGRWVYGNLLFALGVTSFNDADYARALHGMLGSKELAERVAKERPLGRDKRSPIEVFSDVAGEAHYSCPHAEQSEAMSRHTPTWLAEFRIRGPIVHPKLDLAAYHGVDSELLFGGGWYGSAPLPLNAEQAQAARTLRAMVARFMRTGDPNGPGLPVWPADQPGQAGSYLAFDAAPHAETGLRARACKYWRAVGWSMLPTFK